MADAETERKSLIHIQAELGSDCLQTQGCDLDAHHAELTGDHEFISAKTPLHIRVAKVGKEEFSCFGEIFGADIVTEVTEEDSQALGQGLSRVLAVLLG